MGEETAEEVQARQDWIEYHVAVGQYTEAEEIGWDRLHPPDPQTPPGVTLPYVVGLLFVGVLDSMSGAAASRGTASLEFRLVLGLGVVPALLTMCLCFKEPERWCRLGSVATWSKCPP